MRADLPMLDALPVARFRRAELADLAALLAICRASFPRSPRWNGPRAFAGRWWQSALTSAAAEVWLGELGGRSAGFCVLVTNECRWQVERPTRCGGWRSYAWAAAMHPLALLPAARFAWRGLTARLEPAGAKRRPVPRTWLELIAVGPEFRGQRLAQQLLDVCAARTRRLQRQAIALLVEPENRAARTAYQRSGFALVARFPRGDLYQRLLD